MIFFRSFNSGTLFVDFEQQLSQFLILHWFLKYFVNSQTKRVSFESRRHECSENDNLRFYYLLKSKIFLRLVKFSNLGDSLDSIFYRHLQVQYDQINRLVSLTGALSICFVKIYFLDQIYCLLAITSVTNYLGKFQPLKKRLKYLNIYNLVVSSNDSLYFQTLCLILYLLI